MRKFDTEAAVRQWRARMETATDIALESLDELEGHLAASVDDLRAQGLSEEEAFFVAARRLGDPDTLRVEFRKVQQGGRALEIGIAALLGALLVPTLSGILGRIVLFVTIADRHVTYMADPGTYLAVGATTWMVVGLTMFWVISGRNGARWRRAVDWFRRLALHRQVLIVLAGVLVPWSIRLVNYVATNVVGIKLPMGTSSVYVYGLLAFPLVIVAVGLWLLIRRHRSAATGILEA